MDYNSLEQFLNTSNTVVCPKEIVVDISNANIPISNAKTDVSALWRAKSVDDSDTTSSRPSTNISNRLYKFFHLFHKASKIKDEEISPVIRPENVLANFEEYNRLSSNIMQNDISNQDKLINQIEDYKKKLNKDFFVISLKYDRISYKYNAISLAIMILSTLSTFIEALRLTLTEYLKNNVDKALLNIESFTLSINILMLLIGSIITILSTIIRFKNYREIMEKLKNIQNMITKYILIYNKQIELINAYNVLGKMDEDTFKTFRDKIKEYNKEINDNINILEDIRNEDIIKLQRCKNKFDIQLEQMQKERDIELMKLDNKKVIDTAILNNMKNIELVRINNQLQRTLMQLN
jgi:hypothetical protein